MGEKKASDFSTTPVKRACPGPRSRELQRRGPDGNRQFLMKGRAPRMKNARRVETEIHARTRYLPAGQLSLDEKVAQAESGDGRVPGRREACL